MEANTVARLGGAHQEERDARLPLVLSDKLMGHADKRQLGFVHHVHESLPSGDGHCALDSANRHLV
jgi:hypothetical protein